MNNKIRVREMFDEYQAVVKAKNGDSNIGNEKNELHENRMAECTSARKAEVASKILSFKLKRSTGRRVGSISFGWH